MSETASVNWHSCLTYLNFIVFTNWNTTNVVFLFQFFRQWSGHQLPTNVWWRREVAFAVFAPIGGNVLVEFHFRLTTVVRWRKDATKTELNFDRRLNFSPKNPMLIEFEWDKNRKHAPTWNMLDDVPHNERLIERDWGYEHMRSSAWNRNFVQKFNFHRKIHVQHMNFKGIITGV